jgi:hypothetical protein
MDSVSKINELWRFVPGTSLAATCGSIAIHHRRAQSAERPIMFAFITKSKGKYILEIRTSHDLSQGEQIARHPGLTKRECRDCARQMHATPWNF